MGQKYKMHTFSHGKDSMRKLKQKETAVLHGSNKYMHFHSEESTWQNLAESGMEASRVSGGQETSSNSLLATQDLHHLEHSVCIPTDPILSWDS
jgi:hypothetical protein